MDESDRRSTAEVLATTILERDRAEDALEKVTRWLEVVLTQQEVHGLPISAHARDAVAESRALLATDEEEDGDA